MIYLSGRMDGVSIEDGNNWRMEAQKVLENAGFDVYNPYSGLPLTKKAHEDCTPNEVFHRDIYFLDKSDIVLVNLMMPPTIESKNSLFFSIGELFLANRDRKPIVAFTNTFNGRAGYEAIVSKSLTNMDDAINYIIENY